MAVYNNIIETIGKTPIVRLKKIEEYYKLNNRLFAKLESFNPSGSVKARPAYYMFYDLILRGIVNKTTVLIESTSGNTGIGLAMVAAYYGNRIILVMPDSLSKERISHMKLYGAEIVLTPGKLGIKGANEEAKRLNELTENSVIPSQFTNPENPESHYQTTVKEILQDISNPDYLFSGIGTGGTITGISRYLHEFGAKTSVIGIEPSASNVLTGGNPGPHKIQGIGAGFIPETLSLDYVKEVITVKDESAIELTKLLPKLEGISAGISSGACLSGAIDYIIENKIEDKDIVLIFPDSAEKYFSTGIFND